MCGIVGKLNFDPAEPVGRHELQRMTSALRHRGPDDDGIWIQGNIGLGHRRLAILDLSSSGRNPMCNEDGTVWIVLNGEIYNFRELRRLLERRGHRFRSHTDTEVVLHLYEECGPDCVQHLRGMFAFAVWDGRTQQLLLARDRIGVKPLFYATTPHALWFASEIKGILASGQLSATPDFNAIHQYLLWSCISSPQTGFSQIKKLPPGWLLECPPTGPVQIRRYWQLQFGVPIQAKEEALAQEVRARVQEATEARLTADVPIGLFLSGGIDSACVLAAARRRLTGRINTFSVAFGLKAYDESRYARLLARHFETCHHETEVTANAVQLFPKIAGLFDEPFGDSSAVPTYALAEYTSNYVKVALSGDGGDESFGGYRRYLALKAYLLLNQLPGAKWLKSLACLLPSHAVGQSRQRYLPELGALVGRTPRDQYQQLFLGLMHAESWKSLYSQSFREAICGGDEGTFLFGWDTPGAPDDLARAMAADTLSYIPEDLNTKVDICSMACGLEVRSPFLDHRLVEFCADTPSRDKVRWTAPKYILKKAFGKELPAEILHRRKCGFAVPIAEWFGSDLREFACDSLLGSQARVQDFFETEKIRQMLKEHIAGQRNWHHQLWRVLVLEFWLQAQASRPQGQSPRALEAATEAASTPAI